MPICSIILDFFPIELYHMSLDFKNIPNSTGYTTPGSKLGVAISGCKKFVKYHSRLEFLIVLSY
jgi:hypothetical protein